MMVLLLQLLLGLLRLLLAQVCWLQRLCGGVVLQQAPLLLCWHGGGDGAQLGLAAGAGDCGLGSAAASLHGPHPKQAGRLQKTVSALEWC